MADGPQTNAKFDITERIAPYLDVHLMFPLLHFLETNKMYSDEDLARAKLELLAGSTTGALWNQCLQLCMERREELTHIRVYLLKWGARTAPVILV